MAGQPLSGVLKRALSGRRYPAFFVKNKNTGVLLLFFMSSQCILLAFARPYNLRRSGVFSFSASLDLSFHIFEFVVTMCLLPAGKNEVLWFVLRYQKIPRLPSIETEAFAVKSVGSNKEGPTGASTGNSSVQVGSLTIPYQESKKSSCGVFCGSRS